MTATGESSSLHDLTGAAHVCWVVDDDAIYVPQARQLLTQARAAGRKPVAFGPQGSLAVLEPVAAVTLDPRLAILEGGPLLPDKMFAAFRDQTAIAHTEGFDGLCVVADMDWLIPAKPSADDVVAFELLLDQVVSELGAAVVCAYRRSSFDASMAAGTLAVHPIDLGNDTPPQFRLVARGPGRWHLSGELDLAVESHFAAAVGAATSQGDCEIDVSDLQFIDVRSMSLLAVAAKISTAGLRLLGASEALRHYWQLGQFDELAPTVELAA